MAKVTNAVASYDVTTNREDLADAIYNISPVDTPFMSAVPRARASAVLHEWSTDSIDKCGSDARNASAARSRSPASEKHTFQCRGVGGGSGIGG
jgi:hypothetical protein